MSAKMSVYFVTFTGHVLGAVTRAADSGPEGLLGVEDVLVRGVATPPLSSTYPKFLVPGTTLSAQIVDPDPELLLRPLAYQVLQVPDKSREVKPLGQDTVDSITLSSNQIHITLATPFKAQADESVWSLIAGGTLPAPRVESKLISFSQGSASLPIERLPQGTYDVLVLVGGRLPFAQSNQPI